MGSLVFLSTWLLAVAAADDAPVLVTAPSRDAALGCPANAALTKALQTVMPQARVAPDGVIEGDALRVTLLPHHDGGWSLRVQEADGTAALTRPLPGAPGDCAAMADASALIVERYLVEVRWRGQDTALSALPPSAPLPTVSQTPWVRALSVSVGPSARLPLTTTLAPGVGISLRARLGERAFVEVSGGGFDVDRTPVRVDGRELGELVARTVPLFAAGGWCSAGVGSLSACVGPTLGVLLLSGGATGGVHQKRHQTVATPEAGALVRLIQPLGRSVEVGGDLRVGVPLSQAALVVGGTDARVATPPVDVEAGLRIGWRFFP